MRPYKAYFPRKDAYARRICRLLVFTAIKSKPKRHPNVFRCFHHFGSSFHQSEGTATQLSKPLLILFIVPSCPRLLFSSLLFMFPLLFTKCAGSFLSSQWLTIHRTPGRIRTHTAQILSLLSPAVGLLEQNHHRGSRTPSFWFVAKCFIH